LFSRVISPAADSLYLWSFLFTTRSLTKETVFGYGPDLAAGGLKEWGQAGGAGHELVAKARMPKRAKVRQVLNIPMIVGNVANTAHPGPKPIREESAL
jgi:hypothetical protein